MTFETSLRADADGQEPAARASVLIVEDDPGSRLLTQAALRREGFSTILAEDGEQAVEKALRKTPDIVLMDVEMPNMNGFEACRRIRSHPRGEHLPVVMVTGLNDNESVSRAYDAGATDFVHKPINLLLLGHRIRYILRASSNVVSLQVSESKNRALLQSLPDHICLFTADGRVVETLNDQFASGPACNIGDRIDEILEPQQATVLRDCIARTVATQQLRTCEFSVAAGEDAMHFESRCVPYSATQALCVVRNITHRRVAEAQIRKMAYFDDLTGLPNRESFRSLFANAIASAGGNGERLALLFVDLDRFKRINDTLGHAAGDSLLRAVAGRLRSCLRTGDIVCDGAGLEPAGVLARLGGDEFVIMLRNLCRNDDAAIVAERICRALSIPSRYGDHEFVVTPSIGIATFPQDGDTFEQLVRNADSAMYQAKAAGRNGHRFFSGKTRERRVDTLNLEHQLRRAIVADQLHLVYQPKLDLVSGEVIGAEALLRWNHPERGPVPPDTFIPLAEETGLIVEIDDWVMETACRQLARWSASGSAVPVAVNLSALQFTRGDLVDKFGHTLRQHGVDPGQIEIEITERVLVGDIDRTIELLQQLRDMGSRIAVDDFGTGYSSLSYLKRFPIDSVKIDRSFVKDMVDDKNDAEICAAIVAMSHSLNLAVVAEGVETDAQLALLRATGCDAIQGYFFCKPVQATALADFLAGHDPARYRP